MNQPSGEDYLICLARTPLPASLLPFVRDEAKRACCSRMLVVGDGSTARDALQALARILPDLPADLIGETDFDDLLAEDHGEALYVVRDEAPVPRALLQRDKFCFAGDEMIPWPRNMDDADILLGGQLAAPAWTRFFFPDSTALGKRLDEIRTILKNKSARGVPRDVLITGETGAGKSFVAKHLPWILHEDYDNPNAEYADASRSPKRARAPFVSGNCASLAPELADSLLFGAKKGAYTGCTEDRIGLLESAGDGILFLDEIGELPLQTQSKLLTALEERTFCRLGDPGRDLKQLKCTIVFGTNRNLDEAITLFRETRGTSGFRPDLLYRINACHLAIPPLRTRLRGDGSTFTPSGYALLKELIRATCDAMDLRLTVGARMRFEEFARTSPWCANYRDFTHVFQLLKVETLRTRVGNVVPTATMIRILASIQEPAGAARTNKNDSDLLRTVKEGRPNCDRHDLDFVFACARGAQTCAEAGRAYYGDDRNHSDAFGKHLKAYGLRFNAQAPDHLAVISPARA